jgi:prepilin-type N-terminal cleavage/methylation domain-containing protein
MHTAFKIRHTKGVTLVELLVVLAIIGLLATIAIPVYINRIEQAKIRTGQTEVGELAKAEEICGVSHGYFVPFQMLDDLPVNTTSSNADDDDLLQENNVYLIDLSLPARDQLSSQARLNDYSTDSKVAALYNYWLGPFMNSQRVYIGDAQTNDPAYISNTIIHLDYPLDPWGTPYRFYSSEGIIGSNATADTAANPSALDNFSFSDGRITTSDDRFDRYAVVSYGPDRLSDQTGSTFPDDIIYYFGTVYTETTYRALTLIP